MTAYQGVLINTHRKIVWRGPERRFAIEGIVDAKKELYRIPEHYPYARVTWIAVEEEKPDDSPDAG